MTREETIKVLRTESIELGGSATSVCRFLEALDMAVKALEDVTGKDVGKNEPLTLDELRQMDAPVWLRCYHADGDGYWCLCKNGIIITPSGEIYDVVEIPHWALYRQKLEEETV